MKYMRIYRSCAYMEAKYIWRLKLCTTFVYAHIWKLCIYGRCTYMEAMHIWKLHIYGRYTCILYMHNFYICTYIMYMPIPSIYAQLPYMLNFCTCTYLLYICIYYICETSRYAHIRKIGTYMEEAHIWKICAYTEDMHIYERCAYTKVAQHLYMHIFCITRLLYTHISFVYAKLSYMCIYRSYTYTKVALVQRLCTTSTFNEVLEKYIRPLSRMARRWPLKIF